MCTCLLWALPLSASDPHISPPTGGRWQHVKRVTAVGLMYSTLKLKWWGDFRFNHQDSQVGDRFLIFVLACLGRDLCWCVELRWIYDSIYIIKFKCCPVLPPYCRCCIFKQAKIKHKNAVLSLVRCFVSSSLMLLAIFRSWDERIKASHISDDYFSRPLNQHFFDTISGVFEIALCIRGVSWAQIGVLLSTPSDKSLSGSQRAFLVCLKWIRKVLAPLVSLFLSASHPACPAGLNISQLATKKETAG